MNIRINRCASPPGRPAELELQWQANGFGKAEMRRCGIAGKRPYYLSVEFIIRLIGVRAALQFDNTDDRSIAWLSLLASRFQRSAIPAYLH
jgi:hypothetical protein